MMKLTKNEIRFSKSIRPTVGDVVEFDPVIILVNDVVKLDVRTFLYDFMKPGAKCEVVENCEFTIEVKFLDCKDEHLSHIVSPEYLVKRELTEEMVEMIEKLKRRLGIGD